MARAVLFVLLAITAVAPVALAPTGAAAFADGSVRFAHFASHFHHGSGHRLDPYKS